MPENTRTQQLVAHLVAEIRRETERPGTRLTPILDHIVNFVDSHSHLDLMPRGSGSLCACGKPELKGTHNRLNCSTLTFIAARADSEQLLQGQLSQDAEPQALESLLAEVRDEFRARNAWLWASRVDTALSSLSPSRCAVSGGECVGVQQGLAAEEAELTRTDIERMVAAFTKDWPIRAMQDRGHASTCDCSGCLKLRSLAALPLLRWSCVLWMEAAGRKVETEARYDIRSAALPSIDGSGETIEKSIARAQARAEVSLTSQPPLYKRRLKALVEKLAKTLDISLDTLGVENQIVGEVELLARRNGYTRELAKVLCLEVVSDSEILEAVRRLIRKITQEDNRPVAGTEERSVPGAADRLESLVTNAQRRGVPVALSFFHWATETLLLTPWLGRITGPDNTVQVSAGQVSRDAAAEELLGREKVREWLGLDKKAD